MRRLIVISNIILAGIFAYRVLDLWGRINHEGKARRLSLEYRFADIKRPSIHPAAKWRGIFGLEANKGQRQKRKPAGSSAAGEKASRELVSGNLVLRVKGIFIWGPQRFAVISVVKGVRKGAAELRKVGVGDEIEGYTLTSILPGIVTLKGPSSEAINLRIFKS